MKKFILISLLALSAPVTSFAAEEMENAANLNNSEESLEAAPRRFPRLGYQCVATNLRRQRFVGRDWNLGRARREALNICNRRSFFRCHIERCSRVWF